MKEDYLVIYYTQYCVRVNSTSAFVSLYRILFYFYISRCLVKSTDSVLSSSSCYQTHGMHAMKDGMWINPKCPPSG